MVVHVPDGDGWRGEDVLKAEYKGKYFEVLLTEGKFQLIDTTGIKDLHTLARYEDAWIYHLCDEYERHMTDAKAALVGLLSNKEICHQECKYCGARIPDGLIGQWKMLNWKHMEEISRWDYLNE
jgi:hypothetical protein